MCLAINSRFRVEDAHVIVAEPGRQNLRQNAQCIIDAQRIRRLAEPDPRHVESRTALNQNDLDPPLGESGSRCQPADTATYDQDT